MTFQCDRLTASSYAPWKIVKCPTGHTNQDTSGSVMRLRCIENGGSASMVAISRSSLLLVSGNTSRMSIRRLQLEIVLDNSFVAVRGTVV